MEGCHRHYVFYVKMDRIINSRLDRLVIVIVIIYEALYFDTLKGVVVKIPHNFNFHLLSIVKILLRKRYKINQVFLFGTY